MKKNLLALFAVVLAIGFSAFTVHVSSAPKGKYLISPEYFKFVSGSENQFSSYALFDAAHPFSKPAQCAGNNNVICWMKISDINNSSNSGSPDGVIDQNDLSRLMDPVSGLALDSDGDGLVSDEAEDNSVLEKKQ